MLEAFEELRGVLDPPSGAHDETLADVKAAVAKGGAVLAFLDENPVGTGRYEIHADHLYCGRLGVLPAYRGQGVCAAMLAFIDQIAVECGRYQVRLSTRETLESNVRLYERHGYKVISRAPHPKGGSSIVVDLAKALDRNLGTDERMLA